jgi:class 3 adenylate cyclase
MAGRRLTAILAADIAGYSALMSANEIETVSSLKGHQSVVLPMVAGFEGRIIDTAGDGILAEFPSVLNAAKCAVSIQEVMKERNAAVPPDRRMQFRIGINQGDVLFDEHRIFGDGINIAARLEGLCDPGDICISGKVYDEIRERFEVQYEDIGPQKLKNIANPIRVYKIRVAGAAKKPVQGQVAPHAASVSMPPLSNSPSVQRNVWIATAAIAILLIGAGAAWWTLPLGQSSERPETIRQPVVASAPATSTEQSFRPSGGRAEADAGRENIQLVSPDPEPPVPSTATKSIASLEPAPPAAATAPPQRVETDAASGKFIVAAVPNEAARPVSPPPLAIPPQPLPPTNVAKPENKPADSSWDVAALARQGQQSAKDNDYSRAKLYFDEILRIQPKNVEALNNRCWVSAILGDLTSALKDCDTALQLRPNYIDAFDSRGFVKLKSGAPRDAIDDYDAALRLQSQKASSLYGRGIAKKRTGNAAGGNVDIERAKAIDPRIADEFANYGVR